MFADLLKKLTAPNDEQLEAGDERLALTALLVRGARSDRLYAHEEVAQIEELIALRFDLSGPDAKSLRQQAETLEEEAPDTVRFTKSIKDHVPYEARLGVIEAMWKVALADGGRDAEEDALIRLVASLLGVKDRDSALARQRVS